MIQNPPEKSYHPDMNPSTKGILAALLGAACAIAGALYAQRVINENNARTAAQQPVAPASVPAQ